MARQRLYIVHGRGNDAVGLVGSITAPIGKAGGNIVDLRQDVLHGLFTIYMVVDLSETDLRLDDLSAMAKEIGEDTGLVLSVDKYLPVARSPNQNNILLILVGADRPGIIASVSETLGKHRANIELAQTIAREGVFLMELLTDVSQCRIPLPNLMTSIRQTMSAMNMTTMFQTEDVFNKKKRIILFEVASSFIDPSLRSEVVEQTGLDPEQVAATYAGADALASLRKAAALLDGFPVEVMGTIVEGINASSGTVELMQTLKTMGYRVVLVSTAFNPLTDYLQGRLGFDRCLGIPICLDDDAQTLLGGVEDEDYAAIDPEQVVPQIAAEEKVPAEDITVISDAGLSAAPGIRLQFDLGQLLHLHNEHVISAEQLLGLLGSFGVPRA